MATLGEPFSKNGEMVYCLILGLCSNVFDTLPTTPTITQPVRLLLKILRFLDDFAIVPFFGLLICIFIAVLILRRLSGKAQFKKKVNVLLMISCWMDVFACGFQVLADILGPLDGSRPPVFSVLSNTPYLWAQNIAMLFLFLSRKMGVVIALYWKTYSTNLIP